MGCEAYEELVTAAVDGALGAGEARRLEDHLAVCAPCAALRRRHAAVRARLRSPDVQRAVPAPVRAAVLAALDTERSRLRPSPERAGLRRVVLVGALAAGMLLVLFWPSRPPQTEILATLADDVRAAEADEVRFALQTTDAQALRRYYLDSGRIDFADTVADLTGAGFELVGGTVSHVAAVDTTLTVYQNGPHRVLCRRFRTGSIPLPPDGEHIGPARFLTYHGVNIAIIDLGDVTCCLATRLPLDVFKRALAAATHH